jgi:beta-glucosidase
MIYAVNYEQVYAGPEERPAMGVYDLVRVCSKLNRRSTLYSISYGRIDNVHCSENPRLLRILRNEWGFEGIVMSDW